MDKLILIILFCFIISCDPTPETIQNMDQSNKTCTLLVYERISTYVGLYIIKINNTKYIIATKEGSGGINICPMEDE